MQTQIFKLHEAKTDRTKKRNGQIHNYNLRFIRDRLRTDDDIYPDEQQ